MNNLTDLVRTIEPVSLNERRHIYSIEGCGPFPRVHAFAFFPSEAPGGNHYHAKLTEYFLVITGCMTKLVLENSRSKERMAFLNLGPGSLIVIPPFIAHANCFAPGTTMIACCTTAFDPGDPDTFPYPLIDKHSKEIAR